MQPYTLKKGNANQRYIPADEYVAVMRKYERTLMVSNEEFMLKEVDTGNETSPM